MGENERIAVGGLDKVGEMKEDTIDFLQTLEDQKELIPEHFGEKDELGENIEEYIDEIKEYVSDNIKAKLETIENSRGNIIDAARSIDNENTAELNGVEEW